MPWQTAMDNAADELGLNRAEFVTLIFGCEPLNDVAYALGIYETMREGRFEKERIIKEFGFDKMKR